jgi:hypothetical protein
MPTPALEVKSMLRKIIVLLAMTALSGCSQTVYAPTAPATSTDASLPAGFPDLAALAEADHGTYDVTQPQAQGFAFSTPNGTVCGNNSYPDAEFEHLFCSGPRPDKGPGLWSVDVDARDSGPATVERLPDPPQQTGPAEAPYPVLAPGHKLTASKGTSVCGIADDGTVACRLGAHGFMLTADKTTLF